MLRFLLRRSLGALPVLWGAVTIAFLTVHLLPGDPVTLLLIRSGASAEAIAERRAMLGWDRPLLVQYGAYLLGLLRGDLGRSWVSGDSVARLLAEQWPSTLELALAAMGVAITIGILLGAIAALKPGTWSDRLSMGIALLGLSTPIAWSGLLVIWLFSLILGWFSSGGQGGFSHLLLPAVVLGLASAGPIARLTRSGMIEVLSEPFIMAARAKGLPPWMVLIRHVAPMMLPPVLTMAALQFGFLLGGVAVTEALFARQGIGRLAVQAIVAQDLPLIQGIVLLGAVVYTLVNLLADIAQWALDPRGRL
ncbi:MAG TPA: ABC transporter permease [Caldilineae bacterium]|nr:ABC transporter permease [Caldilineae bacterium]